MTRTAQAAHPTVGRRQRLRLAVEHLLLFYGVVAAYAWFDIPGGPIPPLLLLGVAAAVYLRRRPDFDRADLTRAAALRPALPAILGVWVVMLVLAAALVALTMPHRLFELPREAPLIWLAVMVFYPLLSVYPQELIFRAFLFHRYGPVFGTGTGLVAASAAAFGFAHIIFGNVWSVLLTLAAGWLFARRYHQTRSLLATSVEHALYGILAFTVGLGDLFYHGATT
ncbi:CPBP family glutamic-type intramembrane protease [Micromonospora sp. WMMD812]|uniref:CPBP family glutamic-type intramembrane protease n=1 Tax=Micromonospora sp. WMMD812 TaxID=3015152 RepID=UPI00248BACFD|nr:CPBP family glutamic-type intramembrane protease [Micromonospora sp. WMMD812]WBB68149.1 CPBP family glutamic-type intramembrane protease [Micromonospora sp. WMMD812]